MEYDLHSQVSVENGIAPQALAATTDGAVIDTLGFESLEWLLHIGTAFVGGGFTVSFEESDVVTFGGEETAVPAANVLGDTPVVSIGDANTVFRVGIIGKKRFQRITLTETGTISAGVIGVVALLGHAKSMPTAEQAT